MKKKLKASTALAILFVNLSIRSQDSMANVGLYSTPPIYPVNPPIQSQQQKVVIPKDPLREIDGKVYSAVSMSSFYGVVLEVQPNGIRVQGIYEKPFRGGGGYGPKGVEDYGSEFFVEGYPYEVAENDFLAGDMNLAAKEDGVYAYTTTQRGSRTIHKLVYGKVYHLPPPKPLTPEEIAAVKSKTDATKKSAEEKALKYNQEQADKGDAYGLFRMGERYRDGEGVPKDLAKARDYFTKAVAAGSPSAADELSKLNRNAATNSAATKQ